MFDVDFNCIMTKFLDMNDMEGKKVPPAAAKLKSVDHLFTKFDLKWDSVTAVGVDNTNSNIGQRNYITSKAKEKTNDIVTAGCQCHIVHNTASKAATIFMSVYGFDFEDHCIHIFVWFDKSMKRKSFLKDYFEFCDPEHADVIKYDSTRWLLLERCVNGELSKYAGLKSYFLLEEENRSDKECKLLDSLI